MKLSYMLKDTIGIPEISNYTRSSSTLHDSKCLQVQFYQMKAASADTAASLRNWITAAFQTMNEVFILLQKSSILRLFSCPKVITFDAFFAD